MQKTPVPCTITYKGRELISRGATLIEAAKKKPLPLLQLTPVNVPLLLNHMIVRSEAYGVFFH